MNPHRQPNHAPFGHLPDGTLLYPAYRRFPGQQERYMGSWTGSTGEAVGITADGRLYRKPLNYWDDDGGRWEQFEVIQ